MTRRVANRPPRLDAAHAFLFDLDGTLSEIAPTPGDARVDPDLLCHLRRLASATGGAVGLLSGRSIQDIDRLLGGLRFPVAGQHGAEWRTAAGDLWNRGVPETQMLHMRELASRALGAHPELLVEFKGAALALHYRRAPHLAGFVHRVARRLAEQAGPSITVLTGKRVAELLPSGMDKGRALLDMMRESPFRGRVPVFVGDDVSDEPAFVAANSLGGLSVKVGPGRTQARWRLRNVADVRDWLGFDTMSDLDLALIGNGTVAALIDRQATIVWMCVPRMDGDPAFCSLLRPATGIDDYGMFAIELLDFVRAEQEYLTNTPSS